MTCPVISVNMPVYNAEAYLAEAIESVLAQTGVTHELIIVDDGSADKSLWIAQDYARRYGQVRVLTQEHAGLSAARNRGWRASQGDYLAFLDADDWYFPGALHTLYQGLSTARQTQPRALWAYGDYTLRYADGRSQAVVVPHSPHRHQLYQLFCIINPVLTGTSLAHRSAFRGPTPYREDLPRGLEFDFLLRLLPHADFVKIPAQLLNYRRHPQQQTHHYGLFRSERDRRVLHFFLKMGPARFFPQARTPAQMAQSLDGLAEQIIRQSNTPALDTAILLLRLAEELAPDTARFAYLQNCDRLISRRLARDFPGSRRLRLPQDISALAARLFADCFQCPAPETGPLS
ncbi:MAG: glycosyltransferase family 2 protein [Candidatus Sericytochromatia bacterium]